MATELSLPIAPPTPPSTSAFVPDAVARVVAPLASRARRSNLSDAFSVHKILRHFDRVLALLNNENPAPVTVEIDPSNRCNHRCTWCVSMEAHTQEMLGIDTFRTLVDSLLKLDVRSVVIKGGGEPTLHADIDWMLRHVADAGLSQGLVTNGAFPKRSTPGVVLDTCDWVRVSLDAATPETHRVIHGARDFERVKDRIAYLASHRVKTAVGINFAVEPRNLHELLGCVTLGKQLGVDYVSVRTVFDPSRPLTDDERQAIRDQVASARALADNRFRVFLGDVADGGPTMAATTFPFARCLAPNLVGIVGADGLVYPCCFLRGRKQMAMGDLATQTFDEIWAGERRREVMQGVYEGKCGYICLGGMTRSRYMLYNEMLNYLAAENPPHASFI